MPSDPVEWSKHTAQAAHEALRELRCLEIGINLDDTLNRPELTLEVKQMVNRLEHIRVEMIAHYHACREHRDSWTQLQE
jgi:hypothetical protein